MDSSERNERKFIKYALKLICNYSDSSYIILTRGLDCFNMLQPHKS